mmetsp:Transcript_109635/g.317023  ORF Transcript_109635/g.317023 Transcript_109635/m.317023 type:complete len:160 (-) Transcript_109635:17-496(-)
MAELMFGLGQTKKKKETEAKVRQTKAEEWNYKGRVDQDGSFLERKEKATQDKSWKAAQRDTRSKLKDVTQGEDGEMAIRKEQHSREKKWKETGRNQIKSNTNFDMARSLFGGGGGAQYEEEDYVDEVAEEVNNLAVEDQEDEEEYYEEEVVGDDEEEEE